MRGASRWPELEEAPRIIESNLRGGDLTLGLSGISRLTGKYSGELH
jgi:hypothetical protein